MAKTTKKAEATAEATATAAAQANFTVTEDGKKAILAIISNKPFNSVLGVVQLLEKPTLTEQEANGLINVLGAYSYSEVAPFFNNLQTFIVKK